MRNIILFLSLLFFGGTVHGQTLRQYLKAADEAFLNKDYYSALKFYEIAHEIDENNMATLYKFAESARMFGALTMADSAYFKVLSSPEATHYPMGTYWLGTVKKQLGQYDEAAHYFEQFLAANTDPENPFVKSAQKELEACNLAIEIINEPDESVVIQPYGESVNTPHSEFAATRVGDVVYYSSYSFVNPRDTHYPPRQFVKILKSTDDGKTTELVSFNDPVRHTAHLAFNKNKNRVYYTLCDYTSVTEIQCELFYRNLDEAGNFGPPVRLPDFINMPGYTATEPNVGYDKSTGLEWLFFVSNRPKGKGQLDIWASFIQKDSTFSPPFNLPFNTEGNDVTPFFHTPTQTLYFSSDGYQTLGGLDIYKVAKTGKNWEEPELMPVPFNTSFNDSHFVLNEGGGSGFLSSNRTGSLFLEPAYEACCNDLYAFSIDVIQLNILTFSEKGPAPLAGVQIDIFENTPSGPVKVGSLNNPDGNDYNIELKKHKKYALIASRDGFVSTKENLDLTDPELLKNQVLERKVMLLPNTVDLKVLVFNKRSNRPLPGVGVRVAVDGQEVAFQKNPRGNDVGFSLERGKVYQIIGSRVAFLSDTLVVDLSDPNDRTLEKEEKLYLRPKEITEFPPLLLYFDNDSPDPGSRKPRTNLSYEDTYVEYIKKKDLFIREYTKVLSDKDSITAATRINAFFEREVKNGYESLMVFTENLVQSLKEGNRIELEIQGFTSPLADERYNEKLSKRRANCLYNHFMKYNGGILKRYLDSGQLSITEVGYGEKFAPRFISDRLDDERESIYSLAASSERKVAIIGVRVNEVN